MLAWTNLPLAPPASSAGLVSERTLKAPEVSVVAPPPQVEPEHRNRLEMLQTAAVAPAPELKDAQTLRNAATLTSTAVEPAPQVNSLTTSKLGVMNIGHAEVVAPAPRLAVGEQQTTDQAASGRAAAAQALAATAVPPPPSLSGSTAPEAGRMIALGLHPEAPSGAVEPPPGNRRGEFEAGPSGKASASGQPTIPETGKTTDRASGTGGSSEHPNLPAGLKVGDPKQNGSSVDDPSGVPTTTASISIERYPLASAAPPRVSPNRKPAVVVDHPPTDAEKKVFGGRRFYSMTLNMPNLNSAGGSWIVRFAELKDGPSKGELFSPLMTRKSDPAYPLELQRANVQGTVALYAIIHSDGSVRDIRVLDSVDDQLDRFASEALAKCKFEPAMKNGEPVALEAVILVPFRARRGF